VTAAWPLPSDDDVAFYEEHGWWVSPPLVPPELLAACNEAMDRVWSGHFDLGEAPNGYFNPGDDPGAIRKANNGWRATRAIRDLVFHAPIAACAARLLQCESIRLWEDQILDKPTGGDPSASVGWHTDWTYWGGSVAEPRMITAWVPYQDVNPTNGTLQFVDKSHRARIGDGSDFLATDRDAQLERILGEGGGDVVDVDMRAGQVSFHSPMLLHGSGPNLGPSARRATAVHLMDGALRSARRGETQHYNLDLLEAGGLRVGDAFELDQWPVLYPAP
jgi:ectoine hydroxylase-related dioxygenase (phytanoyl-CoA dioxygenase family)